ncbi:MAG: sigma 54-interacting transcriptional regulator [Gemmatimonadales bacterium]
MSSGLPSWPWASRRCESSRASPGPIRWISITCRTPTAWWRRSAGRCWRIWSTAWRGRAHRGTLFLDEAGELSHAAQVKLLRALEYQAVRRVGEGPLRPVRFRLLLATTVSPLALVAQRRWREDFRYRVEAYTVAVPGLRDRVSDLGLLVDHFLSGLRQPPLGLTDPGPLAAHAWPGNVRELRRVVERAVVGSRERPVNLSHLVEALRGGVGRGPGLALEAGVTSATALVMGLSAGVRRSERRSSSRSVGGRRLRPRRRPDPALDAMRWAAWELGSTLTATTLASRLGMSRATLFRRLRERGITLRSLIQPPE